MISKKIFYFSVFAMLTMGCASGMSKKNQLAFSEMRKKQISLSSRVSFLKQRIMVLEGMKGTHKTHVKSNGNVKSINVINDVDPSELPTVKLTPTAKKRLPVVAPVKQKGKQNGRRVVLKLRGVPVYNQTIKEPSSNYGKRLRLGKFYPLKEPSGTKTVSVKKNSETGAKGKYKVALANFRKGRYGLSLTQFSSLIRDYPNNPYVDNALFWQGECWYKMGKYKNAVTLYEKVIKKHGSRNKAPDAMYKMALSYCKLGLKDKGRGLLAKVMEIWPNSKVATKASRQLEKMRR